MTKYKLIAPLIFIAIGFTILTVLYQFYFKGFLKDQFGGESKVSETADGSWLSASFVNTTKTWGVGGTYKVDVLFADLKEAGMPAAATLEIVFDPAILQVRDLEVGNIWEPVNTLEEKLDNTNGRLIATYAQAVNGHITANNKYMTIEFEALNPGKTTLQISDKSEAGWFGEKILYKITGEPLAIEVKKK